MTYIYTYAAVMLAASLAQLFALFSEQKWASWWLFLAANVVQTVATVFIIYTLFSWTAEGFQSVNNAFMQLFMMIQGKT